MTMQRDKAKQTVTRRGQLAAKMAALLSILLLAGSHRITAATSTITWLDPLVYQKPQAVDIVMPNESTVANKYYVDMSAGSGSTCSSSSPCKSIDDLLGKPGTQGGPAYVYVRGTGNLSLYNDTFYGSPGNEIVIKPWGSAMAIFTGNSNTNSSSVHDIIFDGGPGLNITFRSDAAADAYSMHILSDNMTVYRTRNYSSLSGGSLLLAIGDTKVVNGVRIINNEFYGCNSSAGFQCSAIYIGPGSGGGYNNVLIQNNIIRDMGGEGIEVNPRVTSSNLTITGNAIHNVGKQTCSGSWQCRPGVTVSIQSGNGNNATIVSNNLIWDTGSGCLWDRGGGSPRPAYYNNTCYDYGKGSSGGGPNPEGISGYSDGGTATIQNNIIYAPNGTAPFDGSNFSASNNLCASGKSCGSSNQIWSANTLLSTVTGATTFLQIGSTSEARNHGAAITTLTASYGGVTRPQEGTYDIGAFEYSGSGTGVTTPTAPSNLRIIKP